MQIAPYLSLQSSTDTTLEAFRHNLTDVASYHCSIEQVLCHWSVPAVPLVLRRNAVAIGAGITAAAGTRLALQ